MLDNSKHESNFSNKLLVTDRGRTILCKTFSSSFSPNIALSKPQMSNMIQSGGCLGHLPAGFLCFY